MPKGEKYTVTVREYKGEKKASAGFFSPQSIADGFTNNVLGMVGLVVEGSKVGDDFEVFYLSNRLYFTFLIR